jgi:hypothetical protein
MDNNLEDVVRRLIEHTAELCSRGNSCAEIRADLENNITEAVHPNYYTLVKARVINNLALLLAWAALLEDSLIPPVNLITDLNVAPTP